MWNPSRPKEQVSFHNPPSSSWNIYPLSTLTDCPLSPPHRPPPPPSRSRVFEFYILKENPQAAKSFKKKKKKNMKVSFRRKTGRESRAVHRSRKQSPPRSPPPSPRDLDLTVWVLLWPRPAPWRPTHSEPASPFPDHSLGPRDQSLPERPKPPSRAFPRPVLSRENLQ